MATIDMTHRKLNFPPRFIPYLEKHRIFELFHECIELLVQVRPKDHIRFLKNILPCAAMKKDKQRIVFISPPNFNKEAFADLIADCLGIQNITRMYMEILTREKRIMEMIKIQEIETVEEEESCICPSEAEGERFYPMVPCYPPAGEEGPFFEIPGEEIFEEEEEQGEIICEGELKTQEPCICVCPCVREQQEKEHELEVETGPDKDAGSGNKEGSEEGKEGEEGEGEEEELPCIPYVKDKKKKKKKKKKEEDGDEGKKTGKDMTTVVTSTTESSFIETDYGLLAECELAAKGWILQDFPTTGEEAEKLNSLGVIPTHALRIIVDEEQETKDKEYSEIVAGWMKAYKFVPVLVIRVGERILEQFAADMCKLLSIMPHRHAPMLPRIVLIGSRGSGVTTQAQKLEKKYGMVHVEYDIVMARVLQQDDELSKLYKIQLATRPDPELEAILLEKVLLTPACRNRGWVLTGYPKNIDQMRMLDIIATPPNRIIFLEVPARECFVRLYYRKIDPCLGDEYKIPKIEPFGFYSYETPGMDPDIAGRLVSHPKNDKKQVVHDIETYCLNKKEMMMYCGKTASYVDGNKPVETVFELIEQIIINPAPAQPPRNPLVINHGIDDSYERLKKFRLSSGMFFNNMFLNPPERLVRM